MQTSYNDGDATTTRGVLFKRIGGRVELKLNGSTMSQSHHNPVTQLPPLHISYLFLPYLLFSHFSAILPPGGDDNVKFLPSLYIRYEGLKEGCKLHSEPGRSNAPKRNFMHSDVKERILGYNWPRTRSTFSRSQLGRDIT